MKLPRAKDINVYDSLDERLACEHFLGKTLEQAAALFRENSLFYQEDLMWMGPVAFRYYTPALISYIKSEHATGDSDSVVCFATLVEFRLDEDPEVVFPISGELSDACNSILESFDRFKVNEGEYGPLRSRFESLTLKLKNFTPDNNIEKGKG